MHRIALIVAAAALVQQALPSVRVGNGIAQPRKTKDVRPVYPAAAQTARVQGVVIIDVTIGPTGFVLDTHVVRSIPLLDAAAVDAVRQWEFSPTIVNGVPRTVIATVTVNFSLDGQVSSPPSTILLTMATNPDGSRLVFEISPDRAERLPRWDQRIALEPPLSLSDARRAAEAWLKSRAADIKTFELSSASLFRTYPRPPQAGACGEAGCWYYRLAFNPIVSDRRLGGGSDFTSVVLLDGSIVEPRLETVVTTGRGRGGL